MFNRRQNLLFLGLVIVFSGAVNAGTTYTYVVSGGGANDWTNPLRWSPSGVPGTGDIAIVNTTNNGPGVTTTVTVGSLSVTTGAGFAITSPGILTVENSFVVDRINNISGSGILRLLSTCTMTSDHNLNASNSITPGTFDNRGTVNVNTGQLTLAGGSNTGAINATAANTKVFLAGLIVSGAGTLSGTFQIGSFGNNFLQIDNTLIFTGTMEIFDGFIGSGSLTCATGTTLNFRGPGFTRSTFCNVPLTINAGATLHLINDALDQNLRITKNLVCNGTFLMDAETAFIIDDVNATATFNSGLALSGTTATGSAIDGAGMLVIPAGQTLTSSTTFVGGANRLLCPFTNSGTVLVQSGMLELGITTNTATGVFNSTAAGAEISNKQGFPNNLITNFGQVMGKIRVRNGSWMFQNAITLSTVVLDNGFVLGTGAVTITGPVTCEQLSGASNNGFLTATTFTNTASITVDAGRSLNFDTLDSVINCPVTVNGGTFSVATSRKVDLNGAMTLDTSSLSGGGTLAISATGSLTSLRASGTNTISLILTNAGTVTVQSAILNVGSNFVQSGGMIQLAGGSVQGTINLSSGTTAGTGTISGDLNNNGGIISPGNSPGRLTVVGNLSQNATGKLRIEIGGTAPGTEFDQVDVSGKATLDGDVEVVFLNGFTPAPGDAFPIFKAASRSGNFRSVIGSTLVALDNSDPINVKLVATGMKPVPAINSISPTSVDVGSSSFQVTVLGSGFTSGASTVQINGTALPTTFVSSSVLVAEVAAANAATAGSASITVVNGAPGGGTSAVAVLNIGTGSGPGPGAGTAFVITKVKIKFKFGSTADALSVSGTLPLAPTFSPASKTVNLGIGGLTRTIALNAKGASTDKMNGINIPLKGKAGQPRKISINLKKQALFAEMEGLGFRNADVPKPGDDVPLPVTLTIGTDIFSDSISTVYTAKKSASGSAKR